MTTASISTSITGDTVVTTERLTVRVYDIARGRALVTANACAYPAWETGTPAGGDRALLRYLVRGDVAATEALRTLGAIDA